MTVDWRPVSHHWHQVPVPWPCPHQISAMTVRPGSIWHSLNSPCQLLVDPRYDRFYIKISRLTLCRWLGYIVKHISEWVSRAYHLKVHYNLAINLLRWAGGWTKLKFVTPQNLCRVLPELFTLTSRAFLLASSGLSNFRNPNSRLKLRINTMSVFYCNILCLKLKICLPCLHPQWKVMAVSISQTCRIARRAVFLPESGSFLPILTP